MRGCIRANTVPKWQKNLSLLIHISGTIHHMIAIFGKNMYSDNISAGACFIFFKNLFFLIVRGVKEQKMTQKNKNFCRSHSVSQEPYIMWIWVLVHLCKTMTSPAIFFLSFKILIFFGDKGRKGAKGDPKLLISFCLVPCLNNL